jgi:hypothetical protein
MMNAKDLTDQIISRAKNLQQFTVHVPVSRGWMPRGTIPYDLMVIKGTAHIRVYDVSEEKAIEQVRDWIESMEHDEGWDG